MTNELFAKYDFSVYFSDIFDLDPDLLENYGCFNISLINDLPLFIDPFLLFNSTKPGYRKLHDEILKYVSFLREMSEGGELLGGLLESWFFFPEVKQNWMGYSRLGNGGTGLGKDFAVSLNRNLNTVFSNFGTEKVSKGSHLEKLCLIRSGVGRDNISDFTTNLIKNFLLDYTQEFAIRHIKPILRRSFPIRNVEFNYETRHWMPKAFDLPCYNNDFVILTPKDILTKDDTWINKYDIVGNFREILSSMPNLQLRDQMSQYFVSNLARLEKEKGNGKRKKPSRKLIAEAVGQVLREFPEFLDYYIRYKEDNGDQAMSVSEARVKQVEMLFINELTSLIASLFSESEFYETGYNTLEEAYKRTLFLKNVIENKDGYRIFYVDGESIKREVDLQIMFRLTWYASPSAVTREANEGRGPVDFLISRGAFDKSLVEFKLASNKKLKQNLANQVEIYGRAHDTDKFIKAILFFSSEEEQKVREILKELKIDKEKYIILIDARNDNKPSASNA